MQTLSAPTLSQARPVWLLLDSRSAGGIETHVAELALGLKAAGQAVEVVFLTDFGPHPLKDRLRLAHIPVRALSGGAVGLLKAVLGPHRPALIHSHGYKAGILGRLCARAALIPAVSTFHAGEPGKGRVAFYAALDRATAFLCPAIAVNAAIANSLGGGARVIPNFVALPLMPETPGRAIAFAGRLSLEKGPDLLAPLLKGLPADIPIHIFGDGPEMAATRKSFDQAGLSRAVFHGMVPSMAPHWADIGLLLMPSRHEGLPMAALEAMAHGIPVAAFGVGALPQLITHQLTGYLAAPGDLVGLTSTLHSWAVAERSAQIEVGQAARRVIEMHYATPAGVAQVLALYRQAGFTPNLSN